MRFKRLHLPIKVTLNKKSKKSTFLSTQKSTLLKKVLKKYFFDQNVSTKYLFEYLKSTFAQKSTFLSSQKNTLLKQVQKKASELGVELPLPILRYLSHKSCRPHLNGGGEEHPRS